MVFCLLFEEKIIQGLQYVLQIGENPKFYTFLEIFHHVLTEMHLARANLIAMGLLFFFLNKSDVWHNISLQLKIISIISIFRLSTGQEYSNK